MHRLTFRAMGCQMLAALDTDNPTLDSALLNVSRQFEYWESVLSRFQVESELSQLNTHTGEWVRVSATLWEVLRAACVAAHHTNGLVSPTVLAALEAAGYQRSFEFGLNDSAPALAPRPDGQWREITFDTWRCAVRVPIGARLDLGGIAKGWAADRAAQFLSAYAPALVDAGGDIAVSGPRADGSPWPIGVADPHHPGQLLTTLKVLGGGVATSGHDYRQWQRGGERQHHLIDPRAGRPACTDVLSVTVTGPSTREAEAAAKSALILGGEAGQAWLNARPALAGLLVLEDSTLLCTENFDEVVWN